MSQREPKIDNAFNQLDAALCLRARAIGEVPLKEYFHEVTPTVRRMLIDGVVFNVVVSLSEEEPKTR